ncbi:hypothetical protein LO762_05640 [Actinocorallia sp. API 0066]|uniref:DUF6777 domain-containing protein n=1 Tax=Actinocorallia sp. API 0066 TaxID=2896846 RepID=UPI001E439D38|nr:DUF6777 domain-containing protein [Actinocorallia sp. API 0066]MCD0448679.1 hypothetical protein [Actinocorallia sp. API 0066]
MVLLAALFLTMVTACGDAGAVITRLAVGDPGPDAYTHVEGTDDAKISRLAAAGGDKEGDAPGLYGGTRKDKVCDKEALVRFLEGDEGKARAWAEAQGIAPDGIAAFVADLTPVLLRTDTLVTNHGYRAGKATKMNALLQAGIAVMVNAKGLPVVKCNCGNPLSAPDPDLPVHDSDYKGASWPQFSPDKVTVVRPTRQEIEELKLVDRDGRTAFDRPVGTEGDADGEPEPVPPAAASEPPTAPSGDDQGVSGPTDSATPTEAPPPADPTGTPTGVPPDDEDVTGIPTTTPEDAQGVTTTDPTGDPPGPDTAQPNEPPQTATPPDPPDPEPAPETPPDDPVPTTPSP